jgi:hypothetical protein
MHKAVARGGPPGGENRTHRQLHCGIDAALMTSLDAVADPVNRDKHGVSFVQGILETPPFRGYIDP